MNYKLLSALFILSTTSLWAQNDRLSESFEAPMGGLPADWVVKMRGEGEALIAEIPDTSGRGGLLIQRSQEKEGNATVYFTGLVGAKPASELQDIAGSVNFRFSQMSKAVLSSRGVVLRAQKPLYDHFSGYYLCLDPRGENRSLAIYHNPRSHLEPGELLAQMPLPSNLAMLRDYQLKFEVRGKVIRGELWAVDPMGNPSEKIAEVETQNASETPGYFGLRGAYGNKKASTWFHSLHLEVL